MRLLVIGKIGTQIGEASKIARNHGASVAHSPDIESAMTSLCSGRGADILFIDVSLDVHKLVTSLEQERIVIPVVGYGLEADKSKAVAAIKAGAKEYIPFPPDEKLIAALLESIAEENTSVIYNSNEMKAVVELAGRVAPSDANLLITGESGTGKEIISRYIHQKSKRSSNPFISINCAAIPDNLLESELFGHEKGAFTGATQRRIGKFEEANNGTLLLDEISEMDIRLQAKLLRAIQEKEIDRVGGSSPVKLNLRILATSNRNLKEEVANGNFREDLLFRLNVIEIRMPALRERKSDIKLFAEYFAGKYAKDNDFPFKGLDKKALVKLESYDWPGNVRELENTIHRAVLLSGGNTLSDADFHLETGSKATYGNNEKFIGRTVESVEEELILGTVDHCLGNRTKAANVLGISIRTLRNKLKAYEERGA